MVCAVVLGFGFPVPPSSATNKKTTQHSSSSKVKIQQSPTVMSNPQAATIMDIDHGGEKGCDDDGQEETNKQRSVSAATAAAAKQRKAGDDGHDHDGGQNSPRSPNALMDNHHHQHYQRDDERVSPKSPPTNAGVEEKEGGKVVGGGVDRQRNRVRGMDGTVGGSSAVVVGMVAGGDKTKTSSSSSTATSSSRVVVQHQQRQQRDEAIILPAHWTPGNRDVLCGRARDNFHHEGNKFFRELIQQNIGPYLGSANKVEKSEAIVRIVQFVNDASPIGGFVRKDQTTGRWCKIKDSEARDKVGHAIRKAVQRLEDTKPRLAARLKREHSSSNKSSVSSSSPTKKKRTAAPGDSSKSSKKITTSSSSTSTRSSSQLPASESVSSSLSGLEGSSKTSGQEVTVPVASQVSKSYGSTSATTLAGGNSLSVSAGGMNQRLSTEALIRALASPNSSNSSDLLLAGMEFERTRNRSALAAAVASQLSGAGSALPSTLGTATSALAADRPYVPSALASSLAARGHRIDTSTSLLRGSISSQPTFPTATAANIPGTLLSPYEQIIRLQQQQQQQLQSRGRSIDEMQLIRALQRQEEEAKLLRERIGQSSSRLAMNPSTRLSDLLGRSSAAPVPSPFPSIGSSFPTMASSNLNNAMSSIGGQGLTDGSVSQALLQHLVRIGPAAVATTGMPPSVEERVNDMLRRVEADRKAKPGTKFPPSK